jgi:hypothetical protein
MGYRGGETMLGKFWRLLGLKRDSENVKIEGASGEAGADSYHGFVHTSTKDESGKIWIQQIESLAETVLQEDHLSLVDRNSHETMEKQISELAIKISTGITDLSLLTEMDVSFLRVWMFIPREFMYRLPDRGGYEAWSNLFQKVTGLWSDRSLVHLVFPELEELLAEIQGIERREAGNAEPVPAPEWANRHIRVYGYYGDYCGRAWPPVLEQSAKDEGMEASI